MASPILFEVNTRAWLRELSARAGRPLTLLDVPDSEIDRWRKLGITHVWLMGVWQVGPKARAVALQFWRDHWSREIPSSEADVQGSPYAIQEYAVDSRIGDALSLLMFKERLGRAGLRLIIDFVPNHFGIDSTEYSRFPARFVHSGDRKAGTFEAEARFGRRYFAHGRDPYFPPWIDTVQLDYRVLETHQTMTAVAQTASAYADGLRCDMAMLLIPEIFRETWKEFPSAAAHQTNANFWRKAISSIRQLQPQSELIAEVYWDREEELQECGFDFTYNKRVYDFIMHRQDSDLREFLRNQSSTYLRKSVHFIENHDEPRAASILPLDRHKAAAALVLFLPGMALLHDGQLEGRREFARIQLAKRPDEAPDPVLSKFYEDLLLRLQSTEVRRGAPRLLQTEGSVIAVKWSGREKIADYAIVNLGQDSAVLQFAPEDLEGSDLAGGEVLYESKPRSVELFEDHVHLAGESAVILRMKPGRP